MTTTAGGGVILVDAGGDRSSGHWGEMLSIMALQFGARGSVVDGGTRDSAGIRRIDGFSLFTRYTSPIESISRVRIRDVGVPLALDGAQGLVRVHPGDWISCDDDAAIVIPAALVDQVAQECEALEQVEVASRDEMLAGGDMDEIFRKYRRG